jgi:hypothetical protein
MPKAQRTKVARMSASSSTSNANVSCRGCGTLISLALPHCGRCGAEVKKSLLSLFFGQLRRDNTDHFPRFVISTLFPGMSVPLIEPHTSPEGRGKGCSWVFVSSESDAQSLVQWNRRLFMDVDDRGEEVVYIASPHEIDALKRFAAEQSMFPMRPPSLPRQPMVLELPHGSAVKSSGREANPTGRMRPQRVSLHMGLRLSADAPVFNGAAFGRRSDTSDIAARFRYNPYDAVYPFVPVAG